MLRKRLIVIIFLLPILVLFVALGGVIYSTFIALVVGLAAWEFWSMFSKGGYSPSAVGLIGGAMLLSLRAYYNFIDLEIVLALLVMVALAIHLLEFERGRKTAPIGFCITVAGMVYWGLMGGYLIQLRQIPDGLWWFMLVLPAAWAADVGGYLAGTWFGKHAMAPRLSPKKTWEGYVGGIVLGFLIPALLGMVWHLRVEAVTWKDGLIFGGTIALLIPLGDLGASMFKRFFNLKDSSNLIPGHGGVMDRIDTWVWAAAIGYFLVTIFKV